MTVPNAIARIVPFVQPIVTAPETAHAYRSSVGKAMAKKTASARGVYVEPKISWDIDEDEIDDEMPEIPKTTIEVAPIVNSFDSIEKELRVDPLTGVGYCTISGAARISGVHESSLRESLKVVRGKSSSKLAQAVVSHGFEPSGFPSFAKDGIPDMALAAILEYYAMDAGARCTAEAKMAYKAFARVGIRSVLQRVTGYQPIADLEVEDFYLPEAEPPKKLSLSLNASDIHALAESLKTIASAGITIDWTATD